MIEKEKIEDYLLEKGFKTCNKGFNYLTIAIQSYYPNILITKELYPLIAKKCMTTSQKVERAIRHSIQSSKVGKIKNSEFISKSKLLLERE